MSLIINHKKNNTIPDWTQSDLDAQIALGNFPPGTVLADIVLPSDWNDEHTVTVPKVIAEVDFGFPSGLEGDIATVTVNAPWVTSTTGLIITPLATSTADHDPEDYAVEGITAYATNIIDGVSFDIIASAPNGTWGRYNIQAIGV